MNNDIYHVQNPAIGAMILWRFICGYKAKNSAPTPFPLFFYVLPIILRNDLCVTIKGTQKGLSKVSEKLFKEKRNDELYSINDSAIALRNLSLKSFNIGTSSNLFRMDFKTAMVYALVDTKKTGLSPSIQMLLDSAEKLGKWCSELTLIEICEWLKVRL